MLELGTNDATLAQNNLLTRNTENFQWKRPNFNKKSKKCKNII